MGLNFGKLKIDDFRKLRYDKNNILLGYLI